MVKISGCNFFTTDINHSIQIYHSIFEWEIGENSPNHGELVLFSKPKFSLYFDNSNGKCPTQAGSITLEIQADYPKEEKFLESNMVREILDKETHLSVLIHSENKRKIWNENFTKEYADSKNRYESWLDPWNNRIWLYFTDGS